MNLALIHSIEIALQYSKTRDKKVYSRHDHTYS